MNNIKLILYNIDEINRYTGLLLEDNNRVFFKKHHIPLNEVENAELGFSKLVSFLYIMLCDGGNLVTQKNLKFILSFEKSDSEKLSNKPKILIRNITDIRTCFQHFNTNELPLSRKWFMEFIKPEYPSNTGEWLLCYYKLIEQTVEVLTELLNFLAKKYEDNEFNDVFTDSWKKVPKDSEHEASKYHKVFRDIKEIFGFKFIRGGEFCNPKIQTWDKEIEKRLPGYNFEEEASKLIAADIFEGIKRGSLPVPYTIQELNEKYGKTGNLLDTAYYKYAKELCINGDYKLTLEEFWKAMDKYHHEKISL